MPRWTDEARRKQAERIREWRPWEHSTGPVTKRGKRRSAKNWARGGRGSILRIVRMIRAAVGGPAD